MNASAAQTRVAPDPDDAILDLPQIHFFEIARKRGSVFDVDFLAVCAAGDLQISIKRTTTAAELAALTNADRATLQRHMEGAARSVFAKLCVSMAAQEIAGEGRHA